MFAFSLARELGMTVQYLFENMTSRELSEWKAYFKTQNEPKKEEKPDPKQVEAVSRNVFEGMRQG
jgi:hypothetical protein